MLSLKERVGLLESDLLATPPRISAYADLPFAMLRYEPRQEWDLRREVRLLMHRMEGAGKSVEVISLASLLWNVVEAAEGLDAIVNFEREWGFEAAQQQITTYLTDEEWEQTLPDALASRLSQLDPKRSIAFVLRAAALAPTLYHVSTLLDQMQGRTDVTTILFYPGEAVGEAELRFMGLSSRQTSRNYRVKLYS